jgi:hypothetical protein
LGVGSFFCAHSGGTDFENHVGRPRQQRFVGRLHRLALHVGEDIAPAGGLEHLVQEGIAASRIQTSERPLLTVDDEQGPRLWPAANAFVNGIDAAAQICCHSRGLCRVAGHRAELTNRSEDRRDSAMAIAERADAGALESGCSVLLRPVHDHQRRPQGEDALRVGIEQRPDTRQRPHFRRKRVEVADTDHVRSRSDREEHFSERRHE